jgi:hypothetical protein
MLLLNPCVTDTETLRKPRVEIVAPISSKADVEELESDQSAADIADNVWAKIRATVEAALADR